MIRIFLAMYLAALCAASALAETDADYFTTRLLENSEARRYLELKEGADYSALAGRKIVLADLNADGIKDQVLVVHNGRAAAIAAFVAKADGSIDQATYSGFIPVDADELPAVRAGDITGDGADDIRIEAAKSDDAGGLKRVLKFASLADKAALKTVFTGVLDQVERTGIYHRRTTQLVRIKDADSDSVNEIIVETRSVELVGKDREEREIPESVTTAKSTYKSGTDGIYVLDSNKTSELSAEQKLVVAAKMMDAGDNERAAVVAHALSQEHGASPVVVERAKGMLKGAVSASGVLIGPAQG